MSTPEINQVLAQMRVMQAKAIGAGAAPEAVGQTDFSDLLKRSLDAVNQTQHTANAMRTSFERGEDVDLASVMIASQKSTVAFQAMVEVRNKLVDAYKDVMNMPV